MDTGRLHEEVMSAHVVVIVIGIGGGVAVADETIGVAAAAVNDVTDGAAAAMTDGGRSAEVVEMVGPKVMKKRLAMVAMHHLHLRQNQTRGCCNSSVPLTSCKARHDPCVSCSQAAI